MATKTSQGAGINTNYYDSEQDVIGVTTETLEDIRDSGFEEFLQFAIAEFFVAGALWLAIEKGIEAYSTGEALPAVFWVCVMGIFMGLCVGWAGFRQLKRKKGKIDKVIARAIKDSAKKNGNRSD